MDQKIFTAVNQLMKIHREHRRRIDAQVAEIGIGRTQHRILMYVARKGNLPSQKELAEHFEITPAAISGAVQKLEGDGYIERNMGSDNRYNEITITQKGREIVERTRQLFSAVDNTLFVGFSEQEMADLSACLARIIENLKGE